MLEQCADQSRLISSGSGLKEGERYSIGELFIDGETVLKRQEKALAIGSRETLEKLLRPESPFVGTMNKMIWSNSSSIFGPVVIFLYNSNWIIFVNCSVFSFLTQLW